MKSLTLPLSKIKLNDDNPRLIKDGRFAQLVKSLQEFPEMLALRPLVVDESYTVLGGNMRLRAMQHLHFKEALVTVAEGLSEAQKREFVIKDNGSFGEHDWDALANGDWPDAATLNDWGMNVPVDWGNPADQVREQDSSEFDTTANSYLNGAIRQIVLYFDAETHTQVLDDLQAIGDRYGYDDDNTAVVLKLIELFKQSAE